MSDNEIVLKYGEDIFTSGKLEILKEYIQHSNISVYEHSISVALFSLKIAQSLNVKVDKKSLIRGCLLHDYFLYDWHIKDKSHKWHGFIHASIALKNAERDFKLNNIEQNMIYSHMFPLNIRIPKYQESLILCIADKMCATKEIFSKKKVKYVNVESLERMQEV